MTVRDQEPMSGRWQVNFAAFTAAVPRRILDHDAERMELIRALGLCANVQNTPNDLLFALPPDDPDEG